MMINAIRKLTSTSGLLRTMFIISTAAWATAAYCAQQGPSATTVESDPAGEIEYIIVTAQKREEELSKVPISMSAFTAEQIEKSGATDIQTLAHDIPGIGIVPGGALGGGLSYEIRGISPSTGAGTVGLYIDDSPVEIRTNIWAQNPNPNLFDLSRVEVLRGPQGTLYGAGSEGGTIKYITAQPNFYEWSGRASTELSFNTDGVPSYDVGVAAGGPINPELAIRVSASFRETGGYIDQLSRPAENTAERNINDDGNGAFRLILSYRPNDNLTVTPSVFYQRELLQNENVFYQSAGYDRSLQTLATPDLDHFTLSGLKIEYAFHDFVVTSVTSYFDRTEARVDDYSDSDSFLLANNVPIPGFGSLINSILAADPEFQAPSHTNTTQQNFNEELRLNSVGNGGPLQWTAGLYYAHNQQSLSEFETAPALLTYLPGDLQSLLLLPGATLFTKDQREIDEQAAGFGQVSYTLFDRLKLTAGLRVADNRYSLSYTANGLFNGGELLTLPRTSISQTSVTPRYVASYQLTDDDMVYASAAKGYRPGGANRPIPEDICGGDVALIGGQPPSTYKSDDVWSYELGTKSAFFDRKLQINASVYDIEWNNVQELVPLNSCGLNYTDNYGSARSRGAELEAWMALFTGVTVGTTAGYTKATLLQTVYGGSSTGVQGELIGREGDLLPFVPNWTASVYARYDFKLVQGVDAFIRGDYQYSGSYNGTFSPGTASYVAGDYHDYSYRIAGVRAGLSKGRLEGALFVRNLLDARPVTSQLTNVPSAEVWETGLPPRTIGVAASYKFGRQ